MRRPGPLHPHMTEDAFSHGVAIIKSPKKGHKNDAQTP